MHRKGKGTQSRHCGNVILIIKELTDKLLFSAAWKQFNKTRQEVESLEGWKRTHTCGELRLLDKDRQVTLMGWVATVRDHGGVIFLDLRDRYGKTQVVFNPQIKSETYEKANALRKEFVIAIKGKVIPRPEGMINPNLPTGEVEIEGSELKILNPSKTPPFEIDETSDNINEDMRLRYRYLDIRRPTMQFNLELRHRFYQVVRRYFDENRFLEVETPILMKSTPEGARDFLVPSRLHLGTFYALPQSPQTFKQVLMVAGCDRYFQIAKCFRDEDLRADRQPEFTQIDVEMSFIDEEDIYAVMEGLMKRVMKEMKDYDVATPFVRMSYKDAMDKYGSDKPDLRWDMEIHDLSEICKGTEFKFFAEPLAQGGCVRGFRVAGKASLSRKETDEINAWFIQQGAPGVSFIKVADGKITSPLAKFFTEEQLKRIAEETGAVDGDIVFLASGEWDSVGTWLGNLRLELARRLRIPPKVQYVLHWVTDFPLLEWHPEDKRYYAMHHPFTSPKDEDIPLMDSDPGKVRAKAYDLVMNGNEIAGGSIRIHRRDVQEKMFSLLRITPEEAVVKFGFLMEALEFGAPPHGGIAFGFDRLCMIMAGRRSLREVIAFPKNNSGQSLMDNSPSKVDDGQLTELGLKLLAFDRKKE